jgi:uncharacterized protein (DUF111 family)
MRIAYFDCFAGISGEMLLGALLGAGLSLDALQAVLSGLALPCYELCAQRVARKELLGTYVKVVAKSPADDGNAPQGMEPFAELPGGDGHRACSPSQIIGGSNLPELIKQTSLAIFRRLAQAQAAISHQNGKANAGVLPVEEIVWVAGVVAGLSLLGISRVECSPVQVGSGVLRSAEGVRPALSPVAAEMLRAASVPVYGSQISGELVSPVGAAIIATITSAFGSFPAMKIDAVGYGAGKYDLMETPSVLRVFIGETESASGQLYLAPDLSRDQPGAISTAAVSATTGPTHEAAAPATAPSGENSHVANHHDWTALDGKGHQQSGRQIVRNA